MAVRDKEGGHRFTVPDNWSTGYYTEIDEEEYRRLDKIGDDYAEKYLAENYTAEDMAEIERLRNDPRRPDWADDKLFEYKRDKIWAWKAGIREELTEDLSDAVRYGYGYGGAGITQKDGKYYHYIYIYNNCD